MRVIKIESYIPAYGIGLYLRPNTAIVFNFGRKIIEFQFAHIDWKKASQKLEADHLTPSGQNGQQTTNGGKRKNGATQGKS